MRPNSLAFRLLASAAVWSIVVLLITGVILSSLFRSAVERNFDARLQAYLDGLIANVALDENGGLSEVGGLGDARFDLPLSGWYWQVVASGDAPDAERITSRSLLNQTLPPGPAASRIGSPLLRRGYVEGPEQRVLRVVTQNIQLAGSQRLYTFTVAGDSEELDREISIFNNTLFIALTLVGLGVVLSGLVQVRFGLQPLRSFRRGLARIRSGEAERLTGEYPEELQPLAEELNALLKSNEEIVERARTHVGNLAHALKTPLSVITNEAQSTAGPLAAKVAEQAAVMGEQITHYLERARMAARGRALGTVTDVSTILEALDRTLQRIHSDRDIVAEVECQPGLRFRGERQDLEELAGNLMENAFKWARRRVRVRAQAIAGGSPAPARWTLIVEDDGPGLADDDKAEALKRGKRLDEKTPGSGLGLAIVAELVALYTGEISLSDSELGGLRVELQLPAA